MRGKYLLWNNEFVSADQWNETSIKGVVVYEVLRIIDGIPLFFDDHFQRLINSCRMIGQIYEPDKKELSRQIIELARINAFKTGNITLKLIFNHSVSQSFNNSVFQSFNNSVFQSFIPSVFIYFIPHSYPSDEDYRNGVKVGFLEIERNNPEAKVDQGVKEKVTQSDQAPDVYEVMLVDKDGFITEGSRSNMVFVKGNALYTCPLNRVLKGITLTKTLEIASQENIPVVFEAVHKTSISSYDSMFITGTSPKILPVAKAGNTTFDTENQLMRKLIKLYNNLMEQEMNNARVYYKTSKLGEN
jgi:branched-chain amino acid aminotransferase